MAKKRKQGATTFEGGEGATASVTVKAKTERKADPAYTEMKKASARDKRNKRKVRANENISWEGYKK
jgi:hypothetical protein